MGWCLASCRLVCYFFWLFTIGLCCVLGLRVLASLLECALLGLHENTGRYDARQLRLCGCCATFVLSSYCVLAHHRRATSPLFKPHLTLATSTSPCQLARCRRTATGPMTRSVPALTSMRDVQIVFRCVLCACCVRLHRHHVVSYRAKTSIERKVHNEVTDCDRA